MIARCPACGAQVRFNPFLVGPIAAPKSASRRKAKPAALVDPEILDNRRPSQEEIERSRDEAVKAIRAEDQRRRMSSLLGMALEDAWSVMTAEEAELVRRRLESSTETADPWLKNAKAVCLARLGRLDEAISVLRDIAVSPRSLALRRDVPAACLINYATFLLMAQNIDGGLSAIEEMKATCAADPSFKALSARVDAWLKGFSFLDRLKSRFGVWKPWPIAHEGVGAIAEP